MPCAWQARKGLPSRDVELTRICNPKLVDNRIAHGLKDRWLVAPGANLSRKLDVRLNTE